MSDYFLPNFSSSLGLVYLSWKDKTEIQGALLIQVHCCPKGFVLGQNLLLLLLVSVCCPYQRGAEDEGNLAWFCTNIWPSLTKEGKCTERFWGFSQVSGTEIDISVFYFLKLFAEGTLYFQSRYSSSPSS